MHFKIRKKKIDFMAFISVETYTSDWSQTGALILN